MGTSQGQVTVFKGVPGGLAGWDPTIEQRTAVALADLSPAAQAQVRDHQTFSSRADAAAFVARLKAPDHDDDDHHHEHHHDGSADHHARRPAAGHARAGHTVKSPTARRRRSRELGLGLLAVVVTARRLRAAAARRPPRHPRRPLGVPARGARPLRGRAPRGPPLRAALRSRRCCRSCSCSTASGTSPSRASTATSRACRRCGPRSASPRSCSRSWSCATSARSSATSTRSSCSASPRCCCRRCPGSGRRSTAPASGCASVR